MKVSFIQAVCVVHSLWGNAESGKSDMQSHMIPVLLKPTCCPNAGRLGPAGLRLFCGDCSVFPSLYAAA